MKQSVILNIRGHVQGVGFRYYVKMKADSLGIVGFVVNHWDDSVYVEAEGETVPLQLFIHACEQGPSHSRVEKVDIQYCPLQDFEGFQRR